MVSATTNRLGIVPSAGCKAPCKAVATSNITLSGTQTIDSYAAVADDRILVVGQTDASENGIYVVASSAWTRAADYNHNDEIQSGAAVPVYNETTDVAQMYFLHFSGTLTLDTTDITGTTIASTLTAFSDSAFEVQDNSDATKVIKFEASGITTGTTRTITMPDAAVDLGDIATNTTNVALKLALAGGTMSGTLAMADNQITRPRLTDYAETVNAIGSIGGGTQDIDLESGNVVSGTVDTSTTTFTFSNPPATGIAGSFTLILTNGGSQTVNWPASVDWAGGTAPTLTSSGIDILTFVTVNAGTVWYGFTSGLDMQ